MIDQLYQEIILDHYKHPHGRGLREPYGGEAHHVNPTCGDEITVRVAVDGAILPTSRTTGWAARSARRRRRCCTSCCRAARVGDGGPVHEAFVELMQGRGQVEPDEEVLGDGVAFAGVARYPARVKCALLPWMAFKDAAARAGVGVSPEVKAS